MYKGHDIYSGPLTDRQALSDRTNDGKSVCRSTTRTALPNRRVSPQNRRPADDGGLIPMRLFFAFLLTAFALAPPARAADAIKYCAIGHMTFGSFADHIAYIKTAKRYDKKEIDDLIKQQKAGGPDFFSTQVVIKSEQSGSGDFDLHMFQGHSDPETNYKSDQNWACGHDDYPVAYFIGFKVETIADHAITVSRSKGLVNVISLKSIDPGLKAHTRVVETGSNNVLCKDIDADSNPGCIPQIFYGSY
jgi:hypothetical protein